MKHALILAAALTLAACGGETGDKGASAAGDSAGDPPAAEAQPSPEERGRRLFGECAVCHTVKPDEGNRVGPNLFGVYGREAGKVQGFAYSPAVAQSGIVWNDENLDAYIENPQSFLRGNRMSYAGQRDAEKRAAIIAYLKTLK